MNPPYWKPDEIETSFRPGANEHNFRPSELDFVVQQPTTPQASSAGTSPQQQHQPPPIPHAAQSVPPSSSQAHILPPANQLPTPQATSVPKSTVHSTPAALLDSPGLEQTPGRGNSVEDALMGTTRKVSTTKRAVQNRNAQRAFRQRREKYVKELEARVAEMLELHKKVEDLQRENRELRDYTMALQSELLKLTHNMNNDHKD